MALLWVERCARLCGIHFVAESDDSLVNLDYVLFEAGMTVGMMQAAEHLSEQLEASIVDADRPSLQEMSQLAGGAGVTSDSLIASFKAEVLKLHLTGGLTRVCEELGVQVVARSEGEGGS